MSTRTIAGELLATPLASTGLTVAGSGAYGFGAWVEAVASSTGVIDAVGLHYGGSTFASKWIEIEIGTGTAGAEVTAHRLQFYAANNGGYVPGIEMFPVPVRLGPAGTRVALRGRQDSTSAALDLHLFYYIDAVTDHVTTVPYAGSPTGAVGVSTPPNATAWAWSSWFELTAGVGQEMAITGLAPTNSVAATDYEYEIGTGTAGAEVGITLVRAATVSGNNGGFRVCPLSAPHPVAAGTRVAVRMRKSGTSVAAHRVSLLYLDGTALL